MEMKEMEEVLFSCVPGDSQTEPRVKCIYENSNYTKNSLYDNNLSNVLSYLITQSATLSFDNSTSGLGSDKVYGLFNCRGDVNSSVCHRCVQDAIQYISHVCPAQKEVNVWYEECMLRYANRDIFTRGEITPWVMDNDTAAYAPDPDQYELVLSHTLESLLNKAADDTTSDRFAVGEGLLTSTLTLYCLVQCTPNLNTFDCNRCLRETFDKRRSYECCNGTRLKLFIFRPTCQFMWDTTRFYSVSSPPPEDKKGVGYYLIRAGIPVAGTLALVLCVITLYALRRRKNQQTTGKYGIETRSSTINSHHHSEIRPWDIQTNRNTEGAVQYDMETIKTATNNFSEENKLGRGGFGTVYKGTLPTGQEVAVKWLSEDLRQGIREFHNEVKLLGRLQHENLVRLLGFCMEGEEKLIVYEFMPNLSLDKFLFDRNSESLNWQTRFKIIMGIARGLLYLHEDSRLIIHRDLKLNNVLLDHERNPKIADFGLARLLNLNQTQSRTSNVFGTRGYMAPEYESSGVFSVKSDVYSFGVLLLEIISGQINFSSNQSQGTNNLLSRARRLWTTGDVMELVDEPLRTDVPRAEVLRCVLVALNCAQQNAADRPDMTSVVAMLNNNSTDVRSPLRPSVSPSTSASYSVTQDSNRSGTHEFNRPNEPHSANTY